MNAAITSLNTALEFQTDDYKVGYKQVSALVKGGRYEEALARFEQDGCVSDVLLTEPNSWQEWIDWWTQLDESCTEHQKQEAIDKTAAWLQANSNNWQSWSCYHWYLNLIDSYGAWEQKREAIEQTVTWLQANLDELNNVRLKYLSLVDKYGSLQQKEKAIARTASWLEKQPNTSKIWEKYLTLVDKHGTLEQKKKVIDRTTAWLKVHPDNSNVWQKYLLLIEKYADIQQRQKAIDRTTAWLKAHPDDSNVRSRYILLIDRKGTLEQKKKTISEIATWLETHSNDSNVRNQYLVLLENYGTPQQKQQAINSCKLWLQTHPQDGETRKQYLVIIRKCSDEIVDIQSVIVQQWEWMKQQIKVNSQLWTVFLPILHSYSQQHPEIVQEAISLALKQHPDEQLIIVFVFSCFRNYLSYETCYHLSELIAQYKLPLNRWQNIVHAANFFRDYGYLDKAEETYRFVLNSLLPNYEEIESSKEIYKQITNVGKTRAAKDKVDAQVIVKTLTYTYLSYARLLLLCETPDPDRAIKYTSVALHNNPQHSFAHWRMAQCYEAKGSIFYDEVIESFNKAIKFDREGTGCIYHASGQFYRTALGDLTAAHKHFEKSLEQKINLPACIDLAELEIENGNFERAWNLLEQGFAIVPITRPEKEQWEKLEPRLQLILDRLGSVRTESAALNTTG